MTLFSKPKYSTVSVKKKDIPKGLWTKCPVSGEIVYNKELENNWMVVPKSKYHLLIKPAVSGTPISPRPPKTKAKLVMGMRLPKPAMSSRREEWRRRTIHPTARKRAPFIRAWLNICASPAVRPVTVPMLMPKTMYPIWATLE